MLIAAVFIILAGATSPPVVSSSDAAQPVSVQRAVEQYEQKLRDAVSGRDKAVTEASQAFSRTIAKVRADYGGVVEQARTALINRLDRVMQEATRRGELDEALATRETRDRFRQAFDEETARFEPQIVDMAPGEVSLAATEYADHKYRVFRMPVLPSVAHTVCVELGGELALPKTDAERNFLTALVAPLESLSGDRRPYFWVHWDAQSSSGKALHRDGTVKEIGNRHNKGFICRWPVARARNAKEQ